MTEAKEPRYTVYFEAGIDNNKFAKLIPNVTHPEVLEAIKSI